jgi:acetyl esterase/lipase
LPGLDAFLARIPGGLNAIRDVGARRQTLQGFLAEAQADIPPNDNVMTEDVAIPRPDGCGDLALRIFRPASHAVARAAVYYIHGGGLLLGSVNDDAPLCAMLCETLNAVVVAVEYRLAPEHPYPAALDDCVAGLHWLAENAQSLRMDPGRLAVYGGSAGGNLAIATALALRDRGGPPLCFVAAPYPMLDDRNETPSSHEITDIGIWDRDANLEAWGHYLAGRPADGYAAPARAGDLSGLPPMFIDVGEVDLFRDESIAFAARLLQARVPVELHVYPGAYHGSEIFSPGAALSGRIWARRIEALQRALG